MIDTHTHIYASEFDADRAESIDRAVKNGVTHFILPAVDSLSHEKMFEIARSYPNHYAAIGVHPTSVKEDYLRELQIVKEILKSNRSEIIAIGEIGLDYYWDQTFVKEQKIALRTQLEWAILENLPVILHSREATSDMIDILNEYVGSSLRVVFHSYSGTLEEAKRILSLGDHKIGVGGVVTFKKSNLGEIIKEVGLAPILLETDAPYLSPVPHRGKRNESGNIPLIAAHIAQLMGVTIEEVDRVTTANANDFFKIEKI